MAAAAILVVIMFLPLLVNEKEFNPYKGSYTIKNGVVSYDMNASEIEAKLQEVEQKIAQKEKEINEMMWTTEKKELKYAEFEKKIRSIEKHTYQP
jgi:chromosome segregation ATPase